MAERISLPPIGPAAAARSTARGRCRRGPTPTKPRACSYSLRLTPRSPQPRADFMALALRAASGLGFSPQVSRESLRSVESETTCRFDEVECMPDPRRILPARPEQRAAAIIGKAVAIHEHEIDIRRALSNAFGEHEARFIDHRTQRAVDDLRRRDLTPAEPIGGRVLGDDGFDKRIGQA